MRRRQRPSLAAAVGTAAALLVPLFFLFLFLFLLILPMGTVASFVADDYDDDRHALPSLADGGARVAPRRGADESAAVVGSCSSENADNADCADQAARGLCDSDTLSTRKNRPSSCGVYEYYHDEVNEDYDDGEGRRYRICAEGGNKCRVYTDTDAPGDFFAPLLKPGEMFPMIRKKGESELGIWQIGLPHELGAEVLRALDDADRFGLTEFFLSLLRTSHGQSPFVKAGRVGLFELGKRSAAKKWYVRRPNEEKKSWGSDEHVISPADGRVNAELLQVLAGVGFDDVLSSVRSMLDDGSAIDQVSFTVASYGSGEEGGPARETSHPEGNTLCVLVPLLFGEGGGEGEDVTSPELMIWNEDEHIVRTSATDQPLTPISDLNMHSNQWIIRANVTGKSDVRTFSNSRGEASLFSLTLLDSSGTDIKVTFFKEAVEKFYGMIEEGRVYTFSGGRLNVASKESNECKSQFEITFDQNSEIHLYSNIGDIRDAETASVWRTGTVTYAPYRGYVVGNGARIGHGTFDVRGEPVGMHLHMEVCPVDSRDDVNVNVEDVDGDGDEENEEDSATTVAGAIAETPDDVFSPKDDPQWLATKVSQHGGKEEEGGGGGEGGYKACRLYLAESTIPHAGLGIFTGVDLRKGERVAEGDIVVPIHDPEWHVEDDLDFHFMWTEYSWEPQQMKMDKDFHEGWAIVIGTGCMPNCDYAAINAIETNHPKYDHVGLHRSKDVGAGAFTGWCDASVEALADVQAGSEIFVDYQENWFLTRSGEMDHVPFHENFLWAGEFIEKFRTIADQYQRDEIPDFSKDLWQVVSGVAEPFPSRTASALPRTDEEWELALRTKADARECRAPSVVRSLDWLEEHGRCMDNIRPGNSTISQGGRGAFATRAISMGGLVAPGPVLHIANRTALNVYAVDPRTGSRDPAKRVGMQLILNYCFGNVGSTVILCPYTSPSAYINHDGRRPNVRVVWADDGTLQHHEEWLSEDVDFLKEQKVIGLSLNFVATRDIRSGEEVFLDYGPEWEEAWDAHVREWKPPEGSETYRLASDLEEDYSTPLWTVEEQNTGTHPTNVVFYCHFVPGQEDREAEWGWEEELDHNPVQPCKIIRRHALTDIPEKETFAYDVLMTTSDEIDTNQIYLYDNTEWIPPGEIHVLKGVPRWAINVKDKMYSKDEYMRSGFRHEMMIPDDVFPKSWMNL